MKFILWDAVDGIYPEIFETVEEAFSVKRSLVTNGHNEKDVFEIIEHKSDIIINEYFSIIDSYKISEKSVTYEKVLESFKRFERLP